MRRIARRAGHGNVATVQYHFGGLAQVVEAIFAWRVQTIDVERGRQLEAKACVNLEYWVRVIIAPVVHFMRTEPQESYYLRFMEASVRGLGPERFESAGLMAPNYSHAAAAIWALTDTAPEPVRMRRMRIAARHYIHALADVEQELSGLPEPAVRTRRLDESETDLVATTLAILTAKP